MSDLRALSESVVAVAATNGLSALCLVDRHLSERLGLVRTEGHEIVIDDSDLPGAAEELTTWTERPAALVQVRGNAWLEWGRLGEGASTYAPGLWRRPVESHAQVKSQVQSQFQPLPPGWRSERDLLLLGVAVGLLHGLLEQARDVVLHHAHPWHEAPVEDADADPHTQAVFGQAYAVRAAASALLDQALDQALDVPDAGADAAHHLPSQLHSQLPSQLHSQVHAATSYVHLRATEVANDLIGVLGASSATSRLGLDRHWRQLTALTVVLPARPVPSPESVLA